MKYRMMKTRASAFMAVAVLLIVGCGCITMEDRSSDESEAAFEWASFVAGFGVGAVVGASATVAVYELLLKEKQDQLDAAFREADAEKIRTVLDWSDAQYTDALQTYANIWGLTSEHFQREAEIAASMLWTSGSADYDPEKIMLYSGTYLNSAMMLANGVVQPNETYRALSEDVVKWAGDEVYAGNMVLSWTYGLSGIGSTDNWGGSAVYVAQVPAGATQKVYLAEGGSITVLGSSTLAQVNGQSIALDEGENTGIPAGVYTLGGGSTYASDRFLPVIDTDAAEIRAGIILISGTTQKLAVWNGEKVVVDGVSYDNLSITVSPKGSSAKSVDITGQLRDRAALISAVSATVKAANSSAAAVWEIYGRAGHASSYLTTLTVPDQYANVDMTAEQKGVMTLISLEQLSDYWQSSGGELMQSCKVSGGSNLLFIRGDIRDRAGTLIAEDAIFSPYYMVNNQTVSVGENLQSQHSICAIWATGYTGNLSSWDGIAGEHAALLTTKEGYRFDIAEILYDGENVSSVDLDVHQIDYIDMREITIDPTPHPSDGTGGWLVVALVVFGALIALAGVASGRYGLIVVGGAMAVIGLIFGGRIEDAIDKASGIWGWLP